MELLALCRAIAAGKRERVREMLAAEPALATAALDRGATRSDPKTYWLVPIAHYVYAGDTALHVAAAAYDLATVKRLLALGADVMARNRRGATPLHYAADGQPGTPFYRPRAQAAVIRALAAAGGDVRDPSVLHRAVRTRCAAAVGALIEAGARADAKARRLATTTTGRGGSGSPAAKREQQRILGLL